MLNCVDFLFFWKEKVKDIRWLRKEWYDEIGVGISKIKMRMAIDWCGGPRNEMIQVFGYLRMTNMITNQKK